MTWSSNRSTLGDLLEPGDHVQRRRLAAAGWAKQHQEFLMRDFQVEPAHGRHPVAIAFSDSSKLDSRHS